MAADNHTTRAAKRRAAAFWVTVLSLFIAELLFYTWCRVQCVNTGYAITRESRQQEELKSLQNNLKIELARLKAPENIARMAREKLDMGMPDAHQIIVVP
jgi:cell division protein FtsL